MAQGELLLSAPLVGKGNTPAQLAALEFEQQVLTPYADLVDGLSAAGLRQERKSLILRPQDFSFSLGDDSATLSFYLPAGCYATSVLRELIEERQIVRVYDQDRPSDSL